MNNKADLGREGELQASTYLENKGYAVLERNYRYKRSEIDLIVSKGDLLVFVEVKTKTSVNFGQPEIAIDEKKAAKVMEGAEHYIQSTNWKKNIRFDVISLVKNKDRFTIEHFEDAFY